VCIGLKKLIVHNNRTSSQNERHWATYV